MSLFSAVEMAPRDPILGLNEQFNADANPNKVNLGVGVYFDDNGKLPLLACVQAAEKTMMEKPSARGYLPIDGIAAYDNAVKGLVFGADSEPVQSGRVATIQALGGTGGLKIGADFLKRLDPAAKVLILSAHSDDEYIESMIAVGAVGFLEKQTSAEILTKAIQEVALGRPYFSPAIAKRLRADHGKPRDRDGVLKSNHSRLTSREAEVLQLVAEGSANKQVAAALHISIKTVEKHRQSLMQKLNIHDVAGLTRYAIGAGIIESSVQLTIV